MEARLVFHDDAHTRVAATIMETLVRAGIAVAPDGACAAIPTLVFFRAADDELLVKLDGLRDAGCERILAIAMHERPEQAQVWRILDSGASDLLPWSGGDDDARTLAARLMRWRQVDELLQSSLVAGSMIGKSGRWQSTLRQIVEVARFTPASALVLGESGTGKELVARLIHALDPRPGKGELIVVDCTTVVPELSGSEFFGHERGAFTGAAGTRDGAFALARGGTLFLDEVGELPLPLQAQLLRAVQEQTFKRVGGNTWFKTDFRLVCATNRDLLAAVQRGEFRHDLYHRIANWVFTLPPLRERTEDVVPLARHFANQRQTGNKQVDLDAAVEECLLRRDYPGNVRDLRQLVMRIMDRHVGEGAITAGDLPPAERPQDAGNFDWASDENFLRSIQLALSQGIGMKEIGRAAEEGAMKLALREADGNLQRAANRLGVTDRALQLRRASARQSAQPQQPTGAAS
ncbi:MAG TPA: sigma 54-interacting transcriptional regulator [Steroidobacteraceae bacterium]